MDAETLSKLHKLREYYGSDFESVQLLDAIQPLLSMQAQFIKVSKNPAVQLLVERGEKAQKAINMILLHKEDLSEIDRKVFMHERKVHQFYIDLLSGESLEKKIKSKKDFIAREYVKVFPGDGDNQP